jgi:hypothetical protein
VRYDAQPYAMQSVFPLFSILARFLLQNSASKRDLRSRARPRARTDRVWRALRRLAGSERTSARSAASSTARLERVFVNQSMYDQ